MIILKTVKEMPEKSVFNKKEVLEEQKFINSVMFNYKDIKTKEGINAAYEYAAHAAHAYYKKGSLENSSQYMLDRMNLINYWEEGGFIPLIPDGSLLTPGK